ncbi:MAG: hypothetical protein IIA70_05620 [Proteobacteria bacterium]|nr:hypothetical protein [Pseudomonadota bacterium]
MRPVPFLSLPIALLLMTAPATAEDWREVSPDKFYYNADFVFVDYWTDFIVVETAFREGGDYDYNLTAIDCDGWRVYGLGSKNPDGTFDVYDQWYSDPRVGGPIPNGSLIMKVANRLCPIHDTLPLDDLP